MTSAATPSPVDISFPELLRRRGELVGATVVVDGKVFFLSRCPPPLPDGTATECQLSGFLTDPGRTSFGERDREGALPLAEKGRPVGCAQSASTGGACPGWSDGAPYRVVAVVRRQVLGGRTTPYVELDVLNRSQR